MKQVSSRFELSQDKQDKERKEQSLEKQSSKAMIDVLLKYGFDQSSEKASDGLKLLYMKNLALKSEKGKTRERTDRAPSEMEYFKAEIIEHKKSLQSRVGNERLQNFEKFRVVQRKEEKYRS